MVFVTIGGGDSLILLYIMADFVVTVNVCVLRFQYFLYSLLINWCHKENIVHYPLFNTGTRL